MHGMKPMVKQVIARAFKIVLAAVVTLSALAGLFALLSWLPWAVEGRNARDKTLQPSAGILITGLRTALVAALAGLIAVGSLYLAYKNHKVSQDQLQETQRQFELAQQQFIHVQEKDREHADLTREGQVTGRYVEAIKLLASEKLTERLGGIYSLERIMRDSEKDHATAIEVFASFIREHAGKEVDGEPDEGEKKPNEDVQAALTVLGRRPARGASVIDLRSTDLRGASMTDANFDSVDLRNSWLQRASLARSSLRGASFDRAILDRTDFFGADLTGATFTAADMRKTVLWKATAEHAVFAGAHMNGVDLGDARLEGASLVNARVSDCNFLDADLTDTWLDGADLTGAQNLRPEQVITAKLELSTKLPAEIAHSSDVELRVQRLRDEEGDDGVEVGV